MILYLDTSAVVPLLIREPTSQACGELWDSADSITASRLAYVEAAAALAMAERIGRIEAAEVSAARSILDSLWPGVNVIELDEELMSDAARLAALHGLRGYDAVHCAAAVSVSGAELVAASGDKQLLQAWQAEGLAVRDTRG